MNEPTSGPPEYKVYRSRRKPLVGGGDLDALRKRLSRHRDDGDEPRPPREKRRDHPGAGAEVDRCSRSRPGSCSRSCVFMISAQTQEGVSPETERALSSEGSLFSGSNILVLGSDARTGESIDESQSGRGRSDTIMLVHASFGSVRKLSIPRDVEVNVPGFGVNKVNAAYAFGGPALTIETLEAFLGNGLQVNHVVEVDFRGLPRLHRRARRGHRQEQDANLLAPVRQLLEGPQLQEGRDRPGRPRAPWATPASARTAARPARTTATARRASSRCSPRSGRR